MLWWLQLVFAFFGFYTLMFEFLSPESQAGVKFQDHLFAFMLSNPVLVLCSLLKQPAGPNLKGSHDRKQSLLSSTQRRMCPSGCGGLICRGMENCTCRSLPWIEYILKMQELGSCDSCVTLDLKFAKKTKEATFHYHHSLLSSVKSFFFFSMHSSEAFAMNQRIEFCSYLHIFPSSRSRCTGITSGQPWHWRVVPNLAAPAVRCVLRMFQVSWSQGSACWKPRKWRKPLRKRGKSSLLMNTISISTQTYP